jgi:hypothetical protein
VGRVRLPPCEFTINEGNMGYSTSRQTLIKMLPELEFLSTGKSCVWTTEPNESHRVAYKIREALYIARLYASEFPELARAARDFRITVTSSREVQAVRVGAHTINSVKELFSESVPVIDLKQLKVEEATAASLIDSWLANPEGKHYFPQAGLSGEELRKLYAWSQSQGLVFFVATDGSVTLQVTEPSLEDFAWDPTDLDE